MPYGIPSELTAYRCTKCDFERVSLPLQDYLPFCPACGEKQPDENQAYLFGLRVEPDSHHCESTRDLTEIQNHFSEYQGKRIRLWSYSTGHCEMSLRMNVSEYHDTLIYCSADFLSMPTTSWNQHLTVESGENGLVKITDELVPEVHINCHLLTMYFKLKSYV